MTLLRSMKGGVSPRRRSWTLIHGACGMSNDLSSSGIGMVRLHYRLQKTPTYPLHSTLAFAFPSQPQANSPIISPPQNLMNPLIRTGMALLNSTTILTSRRLPTLLHLKTASLTSSFAIFRSYLQRWDVESIPSTASLYVLQNCESR